MNSFFNFFVSSITSPTTLVMLGVILLFFIILYLYSGVLSKIILPRFGYKKYSDYLPFSSIYSDNATIGLLDGSVVRAYEITGVQTSMHDDITKQKFLELRAQLLNQIKDSDVTLRFFMVRDSVQTNTNY